MFCRTSVGVPCRARPNPAHSRQVTSPVAPSIHNNSEAQSTAMTLPTDISPEAQAYLRSAVAPEPRQLTLDAIAERRRLNYGIYAPAGKAVADSLGIRREEEEIAGVPVQCVLPAHTPQAGAVLYFFGRGYVEGSPNEDPAITARLAAPLRRSIYRPFYPL